MDTLMMYKLALPIVATPILRGREARQFETRLQQDLKKPSKLIATPKLEDARSAVKAYAEERKKDKL